MRYEKKSFIILGALCFAIAGKAQGSDVSVQKNTGYSILNDTVKAVKGFYDFFEQRVEMINRMKLKQDTKLLRYVARLLRADFVMPMKIATWLS